MSNPDPVLEVQLANTMPELADLQAVQAQRLVEARKHLSDLADLPLQAVGYEPELNAKLREVRAFLERKA